MKTSPPTEHAFCWADASLSDPDLLIAWLVLTFILLGGGLAIYLTTRWYRSLKQPTLTPGEDLAQLPLSLEEELDPEELQRLRAAIERQKGGHQVKPEDSP